MATQNFLSGGYYGKLGATVGQRWKNKRTIRTYVIPHDPKTPDQIAQRTKFGSGVFYAQLAQQANYSCTFFNSESMTNWNRRMSVAVENKSLFTTLLSLIPLIPNNSIAPYIITSGAYKVDNDTHTMEIKLDGHLPSAARKYTVLLTNNPTGTTAADVKILSATSTAANPNVLTTSELADFEMLDTTKVRIVSSDDVDSSLDMVISAEIALAKEGLIPVPLDLAVSSVSQTADTTIITFTDDYVLGDTTINIGAIVADLNGKIISLSEYTKSIINNAGKLALQIVQTDYAPENQIAWGTSGSITISNLYIDTEEYHYYADDVTCKITQSGTITRSYASTISSAQIVDNVFSFVQSASQIELFDNPTEISVPTAYNTVDTGNENWSVSAVANTGATGRKYTLKTPTYTPSNGTVCYVSMGTLSSAISIPERTKIIDGVTYKLTGSSISTVAGSYAFTHNVTFSDDLSSNLFFREKMDLYYPNNSYVSTTKEVFCNNNAINVSEYEGKNGPFIHANIKSAENRLIMECGSDLYQNPARINCFFYFDAHTFTGGKSTLTLAENSKVRWHNKNNIQLTPGLNSNVNVSFASYTAKSVTTPAYVSFGDYSLSEKDGAFTVTPNTTASGQFEAVAGLNLYVVDADENEFSSSSKALAVDRTYDDEHLVFKATFNTAVQSWDSLGDIAGGNVSLDMDIDSTRPYSCVVTVTQDGFDLKVCTQKKTQQWINEDFGTVMDSTYQLSIL